MEGKKKYLGIDVGGTYIKLGLITETGDIIHRHKAAVDISGITPVMKTITDAARELCDGAGEDIPALSGIGMCAPGSVDSIKGRIAINGGNVPGWSGTEVGIIMRKEFGIPVSVVNDGNAAVLGEAWIGAAVGCSNVICIVLGTGVGGGIMAGGRLIEGMRGFGGEIGHFPTHAGDEELCECGGRGCYERYASTAALVRRAVSINPSWTGGHEIFRAVAAGDADAIRITDEWLNEVAYGVAGFVHVFNPETVLIGGGVSAQEELVIKPLEDKVRKLVMPDFADGLVIKGTALGNDAGMVGAVRHLMETIGNN